MAGRWRSDDPVSRLRAGRNYDASLTDLTSAWNVVGKTKTELDRLEHQLGSYARLRETAEVNLCDYSDTSGDLKYTLQPQPHRGWRDKERAKDSRSHATSRKVSRLDNKYIETVDPSSKAKTGISSSDVVHRGRSSDRLAARSSTISPKRVDFEQQLKLRQIRSDGSYVDSTAVGATSSVGASRLQQSIASTLTDSRAIRETDIRFLNDQSGSDRIVDALRTQSEPRLASVDIVVANENVNPFPAWTSKRYPSKLTGQPYSIKTTSQSESSGSKQDVALELKTDIYDRKTAKSHLYDTNKGIGLITSLKRTLDDHHYRQPEEKDGLSSLKQRIEEQRRQASQREFTTSRRPIHPGDGASDESGQNSQLQTTSHSVTKQVLPIDKQPRLRKIATGPPTPSYKGFNEVEVHYKVHRDMHVNSEHDVGRKNRIIHKIGMKLDAGSGSDNDRPRKMSRVIATPKHDEPKTTKVITPRSWREGQKAVQKALKSITTKQPRDKEERKATRLEQHPDPAYSTTAIEPMLLDQVRDDVLGQDTTPVAGMSEQTRKLLNDLHIDHDLDLVPEKGQKEYDADNHNVSSSPPVRKRKAPNQTETEKQPPGAKVRHYDQDSVRQFIAKQRAQRLQKERDDKKMQKESSLKRKKQLAELYKHQRAAAVTVGDEDTSRIPPTKKPASALAHKQRHEYSVGVHDLHKTAADLQRPSTGMLYNGNTITVTSDDEDGDEDSEHVTEDDEKHTPVNTPRFSSTHVIRGLEDPSKVMINGHVVPPPANLPSTSLNRTRAERIAALKATSSTLQNRIQMTSQKLARVGHSEVPSSITSLAMPERTKFKQTIEAWNVEPVKTLHTRSSSSLHRVSALPQSDTLFRDNLPGVQSLTQAAHHGYQEAQQRTAATCIQAAYRGHSVRQSLGWQLPSGQTLTDRIKHSTTATLHATDKPEIPGGERETDESSTFSDVTDASSSEHAPRQFGQLLSKRVFHVGEKHRKSDSLISGDSDDYIGVAPRLSARAYVPPLFFDTAIPDPYSIINVYSRKHRNDAGSSIVTRPATAPLQTGALHASASIRQPKVASESPAIRLGHLETAVDFATEKSSQQMSSYVRPTQTTTLSSLHPSTRHEPKAVGIGKYSSTTALADDSKSESVASWESQGVSNHDDDDEADVTLEEDTYTQSFDSGELGDGESALASPDRFTQLREDDNSVSVSVLSDDEEPSVSVSERLQLPDELLSKSSHSTISSHPIRAQPSRTVPQSTDYTLTAPTYSSMPAGPSAKPDLRLSPQSLGQKFMAEFTYLQSMEESMNQLVGVEKTRAVAMAQQETVSLAQLLKGRQQAHQLQLNQLQSRTRQETIDATQQLEQARKSAADTLANTAQLISAFRGAAASRGSDAALQDTVRRLTESQTEAARAAYDVSMTLQDVRKQDAIITHAPQDAAAKKKEHAVTGQRPKTFVRQRDIPARASTARDERNSDDSNSEIHTESKAATLSDVASSIRTASDLRDADEDRTESISEELPTDRGGDYSMRFDESMTEDEVEERSFRMVLPSESHRLKVKKQLSQSDMSVMSEDLSITVSSARTSIADETTGSLFLTHDNSFDRFTSDMVQQLMKEEQLRANHLQSLLKLREKSLEEKTQAKLDVLQRYQARNKGADDSYPNIKKKQRGIMRRLQQEQAELRKLAEASRMASQGWKLLAQKRQGQLTQSGEAATVKVAEGKKSELPYTDDETASRQDQLDKNKQSAKKDYKSDSEVYGEPSSAQKNQLDNTAVQKLKKLHFDQKYLTAREQKLRERRKNAEELLAWKRKLDEEEARVTAMEKRALRVLGKKKPRDTPDKERITDKTDSNTQLDRPVRSEISEHIPPATSTADESEASVPEDIVPQSALSSRKISSKAAVLSSTSHVNEVQNSGSESSIQEDLITAQITTRTSHRSGDVLSEIADKSTTVHDDYADDTFASDSVTAISKRSSGSALHKLRSPVSGLGPDMSLSPRSLRAGFRTRTASESESEDSISHTETVSDASDVEGRICALKDELARRKLQYENFRKSRKRRQHEQLKQREESLRKQVEAYDNKLKQSEADLQRELENDPVRAGLKPQIKHPRSHRAVAPSGSKTELSSQASSSDNKLTPTESQISPQTRNSAQSIWGTSPAFLRSESETSHSSVSSSLDESRDIGDVSATSPKTDDSPSSISPPKRETSATNLGTPTRGVSLESISEKSESTSASVKTSREHVSTVVTARDDKKTETTTAIIEQISEVSEEIEEEVSQTESRSELDQPLLKVDLRENVGDASALILDDETLVEPLDAAISAEPSILKIDVSEVAPSVEEEADEEQPPLISVSPLSARSATSEILSDVSAVEDVTTAADESQSALHISLAPAVEGVSSGLSLKAESLTPTEFQKAEADAGAEPPLTVLSQESESSRQSKSSYSYVSSRSGHDMSGNKKSDVSNDGYSEDFSELSPSLDKTLSELSEGSISDDEPNYDRNITPRPITPLPEEFSSPEKVDSVSEILENRVTESRPVISQETVDCVSNQLLGEVLNESMMAVQSIMSSADHHVSARRSQIQHTTSPVITNHHDQTTSDQLTSQLLNDAITQMISIHKKQRSIGTVITVPSTEYDRIPELEDGDKEDDKHVDIEVSEVKDSPTHIPSSKEMHIETADVHVTKTGLSTDSESETGHLLSSQLQVDHAISDIPAESLVLRPGSPVPDEAHRLTKEDLATLNNDLSDLGLFDGEEFFDDDLFTNQRAKATVPESSEKAGELPRLALEQLTQELLYAVPHNHEDVKEIIAEGTNAFWMCRRYGEPLRATIMPPDFIPSADRDSDLESVSRRVYRQMLFDLAGEVIQDIYRSEEEDEDEYDSETTTLRPHSHSRALITCYASYRPDSSPVEGRPTSLEDLQALVSSIASSMLGLTPPSQPDSQLNRWVARKKKDHVDQILVHELRAEEPGWVDYDTDEWHVKMQLADAIFSMVLTDTVQCVKNVYSTK